MCFIMRLFVFCERPSKGQTEPDLALGTETRSLPMVARADPRGFTCMSLVPVAPLIRPEKIRI